MKNKNTKISDAVILVQKAWNQDKQFFSVQHHKGLPSSFSNFSFSQSMSSLYYPHRFLDKVEKGHYNIPVLWMLLTCFSSQIWINMSFFLMKLFKYRQATLVLLAFGYTMCHMHILHFLDIRHTKLFLKILCQWNKIIIFVFYFWRLRCSEVVIVGVFDISSYRL